MAQEINIHPLDLNADSAIGIKLDQSNLAGKIFTQSYTTIDQSKTNLLCLLLTNEGERRMQPEFGCGLSKMLFEPITDSLIVKMKKIVADKVKYWLPYINLIKTIITVEPDNSSVNFYIEFGLRGNQFDTESITFKLNVPS